MANRYPHMTTEELRDFRRKMDELDGAEMDGLAKLFILLAFGLTAVLAAVGFVALAGDFTVVAWLCFAGATPPAGLAALLYVAEGPVSAHVQTRTIRRSADEELARREEEHR